MFDIIALDETKSFLDLKKRVKRMREVAGQ